MDESPPSITKGYRIMRKNLKGCKKLAGETLAGNFTVPVIGSIAVAAMSAVSSYISTALFPGDSLYAIIGGGTNGQAASGAAAWSCLVRSFRRVILSV